MKLSVKRNVSFPVTVWHDAETGQIQIMRPTAGGFHVCVDADAESPTGHPQLYQALRRALRDGGAGFAEAPGKYN